MCLFPRFVVYVSVRYHVLVLRAASSINSNPGCTLRRTDAPRWGLAYWKVVEKLQEARSAVPMPFRIVPYQLRHSGPSIDRSRDCRTQAEAQKRGRWRTAKSLTRYWKRARMGNLLLEVAAAVQARCLAAEARIGDIGWRGLRAAPGRTRD